MNGKIFALSVPAVSSVPILPTDRWQRIHSVSAELIVASLKVCMTTVFLLSLALLVSIVSFRYLSSESMRLDEAQSLWQASHSPESILSIVAKDVHVPLYHMLLHYWMAFFGEDVTVARSLSLLFFILCIFALHALGRTVYGGNRSVALYATAAFAISPFMNWYGNEARMYTMLAFFTILSQLFFLRILRERGRPIVDWMAYFFSALFGIFTHYYFFLMLLSQAVFYALVWRNFPKGSFWKFSMVTAILMLSFAPWIRFVFSLGTVDNTRPALPVPTSIDLFNSFMQFLFGFHGDHVNGNVVSFWPIVVLLAFVTLRKTRRLTYETLFLFISISVPIAAAFLFSVAVEPAYISRYLIIVVPALMLFIARLFSLYTSWPSVALQVLFAIGLLLFLRSEIRDRSTPVKEHYAEAVAYLNANVLPQDLVILSAPFTVYPVEYYYHGTARLTTFPVWNRYVSGSIPSYSEADFEGAVSDMVATYRSVWVLLSYDQGYERHIRDYLDAHYDRTYRETFSPKLTLYEYRLRYDQPNTQDIIDGYLRDSQAKATANLKITPPVRSGSNRSVRPVR